MKRFELEELREQHNGCVMQWIGNDGRKHLFSDAWEDLARMTMNKYVHKCPWIKRVKNETNYDGTRTMTFYEDNGKRVFQYIK